MKWLFGLLTTGTMLSMLLVPAAAQAEPPVQKIAQPKTIEEFSARSLGETEPEHGGAGPGPAEKAKIEKLLQKALREGKVLIDLI